MHVRRGRTTRRDGRNWCGIRRDCRGCERSGYQDYAAEPSPISARFRDRLDGRVRWLTGSPKIKATGTCQSRFDRAHLRKGGCLADGRRAPISAPGPVTVLFLSSLEKRAPWDQSYPQPRWPVYLSLAETSIHRVSETRRPDGFMSPDVRKNNGGRHTRA